MSQTQFGYCVPIFAAPGLRFFRTPHYAALDTATTMALAAQAETAGYDSIWVADHLMRGKDEAILEGWTVPRRARRDDQPRETRPDPPDPFLPAPGPRRQDGHHHRPDQRRALRLLPRLRQPARRVCQLRPAVGRCDRGAGRADDRWPETRPRPLGLARPGELRRPLLSTPRRDLQSPDGAAAAPADLVRGRQSRDAPRLRAARPGLEHHPRFRDATPRPSPDPRGGLRRSRSPV